MKFRFSATAPTFALLVLLAGRQPAAAQSPTVDGQLDAEFYGAPLAVQDTPTAFGNATNGHRRFAVQGSELDAAYARVSDGYLYLFIAGNLETGGQGLTWSAGNVNKLDLFVDAIPGGQNSLRGDNADVDGGALGSLGHWDTNSVGLRFDAGFEADFYLTFYNRTEVVPYFDPPQIEAWRGYLFYATLPTGGGGAARTLGIAQDPTHTGFVTTFTFTNGVQLGFDNGNVGGVWGTGDASETNASLAAGVATGLELALPVELFADGAGALNETLRIVAFVNDSNHRYMSNQVLGPMGQNPGGYGNLGDPRLFNFAESYSPGDQFFAVANPYLSARALLEPEAGQGDEATFRWLGSVGHAYALQVATNLVGPQVWSNAVSEVSATGPVVRAVATNAAPIGFYRTVRLD
ncbi:MAG: hypothetical protein AB7V22_08155 [Kiritimatiellia bacterium]